MKLQLIRHATLRIEYGGKTFLIDPMLDDPGARDPIKNSGNELRNPLVALPFSAEEVVQGIDAVLVTHTHSDHWDAKARELLPKQIPLFCQPQDTPIFKEQGFSNVMPVHGTTEWSGIMLHRTGGQHGRGDIGKAMGPASGFILEEPEHVNIYIAGDTIWGDEVRFVLDTLQPEFLIVNAGAAQFMEGEPVTMSTPDVVAAATHAHNATVIAVHMDTINHCRLSRAQLYQDLKQKKLEDWVIVPRDGEVFFPRD